MSDEEKVFSKFFGMGLEASRGIRFCPPQEIITNQNNATEFEMHKKMCSRCRKESTEDPSIEAWKSIIKTAKMMNARMSFDIPPEVGDIRFLKDLGWATINGGRVYINGPLVVLTSEIDKDSFRAALIYHDCTMAIREDVKIEYNDDYRFKLAIQGWNSFPVLKEDIDAKFGAVDSDMVEHLINYGTKKSYSPEVPTFSNSKELVPNDPRLTFMAESVELTYLYSIRSIEKNLVALESTRKVKPRPSYLRVVK